MDFPKLVRKRIVKKIWMDYVQLFPEKPDRLCMESFRKVAKVLTTMDMKAKLAVDYVSGILLYDNFNMLRTIAKTVNSEQ